MVRQILSNNNESATRIFSLKISDMNTALIFLGLHFVRQSGFDMLESVLSAVTVTLYGYSAQMKAETKLLSWTS
jgi:hypothetical protein